MANQTSSETSYELYLHQRQAHYLGKARVKLHNLTFDEEAEGCRPLNVKNVQRLAEIYESEGCRNLDPNNAVSALISDDMLANILRASGRQQSSLIEQSIPPLLPLDEHNKLLCLNGRHRITAGLQFLDPVERWWLVYLYNDRNDCSMS